MPDGYALHRNLAISALGLSVTVALYAVFGAPSRPASRLGTRGLKRRRAVEDSVLWAYVEPIVRWLGARVSGVLSDGARESLDQQLTVAGDYLGLTADEYVALSIVGFATGVAAGLAAVLAGKPLILVFVCAPLGAILPYLHISGEAQRRLKQISRGLPYAVDLIALGMSAGLDFPAAIRQLVEKSSDPDDALIAELRRLLQELQLGRTRKQALTDLGQRAPAVVVTEFVSAIVQAEERGNPVADVLAIQASSSRQRRTVAAEEAAARAGVAMVGPMMLLFLCIMILLIGPIVIKLVKGI
jgi:tight adherence protein C